MTIWFTADQHLGHENIIKYCDRSFTSVQDMDDTLIGNHNERVNGDDTVYVLGDLSLAKVEQVAVYLGRMNGKIKVIPGGHDYWIEDYEPPIYSASGHEVEILPPLYEMKIEGLTIVLCHYAMRSWPKSHYGSLHLYGHSHCNLERELNCMDVGVDCHGFYPVSLEEVKRELL